MKPEYQEITLIDNVDQHQLQLPVEGHLAIIVYARATGRIALIHTEVPPELEGRGVATAIIEKALRFAELNELKVIPLCPVVAAYVERHPEWLHVVEER